MKKVRSGFTLIEVIATVAILAICVAAFLSIFTFGFSTVFSAGHKSIADFRIQEAAELLYSNSNSEPENVTTSEYSNTLPIEIFTVAVDSDGLPVGTKSTDPSTVNIDGSYYEIKASEKSKEVTLEIFIP